MKKSITHCFIFLIFKVILPNYFIISGLLTSVYPNTWQAAVGHNFFFRYLGLSLAFGLHGAVCNYLKLYALAGALVLATAPYTWLEIRIEQQRRVNAQLSTL